MVLNRIKHRQVPILSFNSSRSESIDYDAYKVFEDDQIDEMAEVIQKLGTSPTDHLAPQLFNIQVRGMDESLDRLINKKNPLFALVMEN